MLVTAGLGVQGSVVTRAAEFKQTLHEMPLLGRGRVARASNEGYPKVREDFTVMEKASNRHY